MDEAVYYPNIIAVGTRDNLVKIFNILSGELIMEFNGSVFGFKLETSVFVLRPQ